MSPTLPAQCRPPPQLPTHRSHPSVPTGPHSPSPVGTQAYAPRNSKSGHQLIQNTQGGILSLSSGGRTAVGTDHRRQAGLWRPTALLPIPLPKTRLLPPGRRPCLAVRVPWANPTCKHGRVHLCSALVRHLFDTCSTQRCIRVMNARLFSRPPREWWSVYMCLYVGGRVTSQRTRSARPSQSRRHRPAPQS